MSCMMMMVLHYLVGKKQPPPPENKVGSFKRIVFREEGLLNLLSYYERHK